ncbi:hypothetical protein IWW36_002574 [Coemansia brasiliensis]|uniref:Uncharacterized protein n=1 Tax=Coemansia brasiliensis TaxID=2650707 RepID=A0A9W8IFL7_9FUNG|nr:hypothetical protein IWW36_002574 [Coemansia brasiliensis]
MSIQHQQPETGATPDSAVLDRMQELECAIASVKSSLDYHASSYYSVASQIAELNARIGRMSVGDKSSDLGAPSLEIGDNGDHVGGASTDYDLCLGQSDDTATSMHTSKPPASVSKATVLEQNVTSNGDEEGDDQYARIQQMINSLIQDADSALNSKPTDIRHSQLLSDDAQDIPANSQKPAIANVYDIGHRKRPQSASRAIYSVPRPRSRGRDHLLHAPPAFRPSSALSMASKLSRGRKAKPPLPQPELISDPTEADAESDSDMDVFRSSRHHSIRRKNNLRSTRLSSASRSRRRKSSGHYSDWHSRVHPADRYRSDTIESCLSNSSETCVSSGNRASREFEMLDFEHSGCVADNMRTPTQSTHLSGPGNCVSTKPHMHEFPCLDIDGYGGDTRYKHQYGSALGNEEQLRSVSALDIYNDERAAAYSCQLNPVNVRRFGRERSNTYASEASPTKAYDFVGATMPLGEAPTRSYNEPQYGSLHDPSLGSRTWDRPMTRRMTSSSYAAAAAIYKADPGIQPTIQVSRSHLSTGVTAGMNKNGRSERSLSLTNNIGSRRHQHTEIVTSTQSHAGLLNMISLLYWTLLFTLGALMLDSFLCQVAGKRVIGTVDKMSYLETEPAEMSDDAVDGVCENHNYHENSSFNEAENTNRLTAKVGRFVRWYMEEEPDQNHSSLRSPHAHSTSFKHI